MHQSLQGDHCTMPLYEPQLLTSEFAAGVPQMTSANFRPLSPIQRRYIYWAFANKMSKAGVARMLDCSVTTVWRRIESVKGFPLDLLDCGFVQPNRNRNGEVAYFCRFCGYGAKTDDTVIVHACEHLFGEGSMRPAPSPVRYA